MTNRLSAIAPAAGALGLFLLIGPDPAQAGVNSCATVCGPTTSCTRQCRSGDRPDDWITCGVWGDCAYCTPNWQVVSSEPALGVILRNDSLHCQTFTLTRYTQRDLNACNPNYLERHYCANAQIVNISFGCCYWGCDPEISDQTNCSVP